MYQIFHLLTAYSVLSTKVGTEVAAVDKAEFLS